MTRFAPVLLKLAAAAATLALAGVGLAVAGLGLPGHTGRGASHPDSLSHSSDVPAVCDSTPPSERGCVFGVAAAPAAPGSDLPTQAQAACSRGNHSGVDTSRRKRHG